jgi:alkyldihydroxyacetonephosphate synthase
VLPNGELLALRPTPRASTGPDLRHWFLGAEGTAGIVTAATLRVFPLPARREWLVLNPSSFAGGIELVRRMLQLAVRPAIVRLYDEAETSERFPQQAGSSILLLGCEGDPESVAYELERIEALARELGVPAGPGEAAERWWQRRFDTQGLLRPLLEPGGIADALEVAAPWSRLHSVYLAMCAAIERVVAALPHRIDTHLSHAYADGANLYVIFSASAAGAGDVELLYRRVVHEALTACADAGGSISHHHGIGIAKCDELGAELGGAGLALVREWRGAVDPGHLFNPGKLTGVRDG